MSGLETIHNGSQLSSTLHHVCGGAEVWHDPETTALGLDFRRLAHSPRIVGWHQGINSHLQIVDLPRGTFELEVNALWQKL